MATFLELVNKVGRESGTIDSTQMLTSFADASPRHLKIMGWVAEAWVQIQNARTDFNWRRKPFSHALLALKTTYTPADLGITDFGQWLRPKPDFAPISMYDPAIGRGDELPLQSVDFFWWVNNYDRGAHDPNRPAVYAEDQGGSIVLGPTPDKNYVLRGFYMRAPQQLIDATDVPIAPEQYHNAIAYKALILLSEHDEAQFPMATSTVNYAAAYSALVNGSVPDMII